MNSWVKDFLLLTLIIGLLFGATLGKYPLHSPDGARYAEIPREMVVSGDYITPRLNGVKYFEKPPLFYWMQAASIKMFGVNDFAVSFMNALLALGSVLLTYLIGRKIYGRFDGILASVMFATSTLVFALTRIVTLDVALTFFIVMSLGCFLIGTQTPIGTGSRRIYFCLAYAGAALAVMTKGLVGMLFPGMVILAWIVIFNKWRELKHYYCFSGILIFCLIVAPWHILVQLKNPEFFNFYFIEQHFLRYLTDYASRGQKWWFLPVMLLAGLYPWSVFLPQAIINKKEQYLQQSSFLLIWALVIYIFYTFSNSQLIPYILPILPPFTLLIGSYLAPYLQSNNQKGVSIGFWVFFITNILLGIGAISAIFALNFSEQVVTKSNLYIAAVLVIFGAILSLVVYRRKNLAAGFIAIAISMSCLFLYISPVITIINNQSIKPLVTVLKQKLQSGDEVICYKIYPQELPFYLQRRITVADYVGELEFGTKQENTSSWMVSEKELVKRLKSNKHIYLITKNDNYKRLKVKNLHVMARYLNYVLLSSNG